ncbi:ACT domain-containing protein [Streptomyces sp. CT34]|uniref:ACT domain-containing protein n=1 Tax=Streptomyces sp. CT34 TaxID=1553907 RepID=UPI0005BB531E|nr:ACT domain-containing protein [Streptomyces sp. CT34]
MPAEKDLDKLLADMRPELNPGEYVFTVAPDGRVRPDIRPVVTVAEEEGLTLVLPRQEADRAGLAYDYIAGWVTLRVHSALDAVGLTAAVAEALTQAGISCNVVAGFHHDHLFVPHDATARTLAVLEELTECGRRTGAPDSGGA